MINKWLTATMFNLFGWGPIEKDRRTGGADFRIPRCPPNFGPIIIIIIIINPNLSSPQHSCSLLALTRSLIMPRPTQKAAKVQLQRKNAIQSHNQFLSVINNYCTSARYMPTAKIHLLTAATMRRTYLQILLARISGQLSYPKTDFILR